MVGAKETSHYLPNTDHIIMNHILYFDYINKYLLLQHNISRGGGRQPPHTRPLAPTSSSTSHARASRTCRQRFRRSRLLSPRSGSSSPSLCLSVIGMTRGATAAAAPASSASGVRGWSLRAVPRSCSRARPRCGRTFWSARAAPRACARAWTSAWTAVPSAGA